MRIPTSTLHEALVDLLTSAGADVPRATAVADEITYAEACGIKSHGLPMLDAMLGRAMNDAEPTVKKNTGTITTVVGNGTLGPYAAKIAMDAAIGSARSHGLGMATLLNASTFLTTGYSPWRAANAGLIGFCTSAAAAKVAPYGSIDPIFGTNPLAMGFPTADGPIVVDMAITNLPAAEVREAAATGESLPAGVAITRDGQPTRDPSEALAGAMLTFGGYKGSALAFMIECLSGALITGAKYGIHDADRGMLFLAIDPSTFGDGEALAERIAEVASNIANSRPTIAGESPRAPGVQARNNWERAQSFGVEVSESFASRLGIA
ncbi:Ldh family oxidoreductase [Kribbella koreensis]|uniref:Ldh family oxidoreductase n=1 Tax=Kribbella koreensis TaxID=57909 RepID=A0ABP3ZPU8_9ACTN